jgi:hypothetical protein
LAALKWEHVRWGEAVAVLDKHKTRKKTKKPRVIILPGPFDNSRWRVRRVLVIGAPPFRASWRCRMPQPSLFDELATLPDPRSAHGRVHPLPAVLGLVVLAMLLGRKSLAGIARFGRLYGPPLAHALGFRRGKTPAVSTLSEVLRQIDAGAREAALARWARARLGPSAVEHISRDGKTLRGSRDGAVPGQHLVAAYAPRVEAVLAQVRVDAKTNEHKAALQLLGLLPLAGTVVVGDAMFCQRDLAQQVIDAGATTC